MLLQNAQILTTELGPSGTSQKSGKPWQMYKYKVTTPEGARWMTSFTQYKFMAGDVVDLTYLEKPSENPVRPWLNIQQMRKALDDSREKEKFGVVEPGHQPVNTGQPQPTEVRATVEYGSVQEPVEEVDMSNLVAGSDSDEDADRGMMVDIETPQKPTEKPISEVTTPDPNIGMAKEETERKQSSTEFKDAGELYDI